MALRVFSIASAMALACSLGVAQVMSSTPPPASGTTTTTTIAPTAAPAAGGNNIAPPGETNVPLGINVIGGSTTTNGVTGTVGQFPAAFNGIVGPAQSYPLIATPTVHFENAADGIHTVPVISYGSGPSGSAANANTNAVASGPSQMVDLNLGNVRDISDLYGGDNRSVAEVARSYKARKNGVQNARVYTNADIDRIRQQAGEGSSATSPSAMPAGSMPASDQAAEQNNQGTTPQVPAPPANQKPSPFTPKK
jgi:hypothetical protein